VLLKSALIDPFEYIFYFLHRPTDSQQSVCPFLHSLHGIELIETGMLPIITLLATAGAVAPLVSASASSKTRSHNPHNPHRKLLKREITDDASTVDGQTYDFIIAGGGLAGLAMAARLSEWSNQTVLVVEAGGDGSGTLADGRIVQDMIDIPGTSNLVGRDCKADVSGNSYLHGLTNTAWDWAYDTIPQASANNLVKDWPRGKGLGGSGAVNGMYWNRGNRENYEAWKSELSPPRSMDRKLTSSTEPRRGRGLGMGRG